MLTRYERHPTMLLIRRCRRGSTTSGESCFVKRTFGSIGVSTGLQSHIPKVRSTRSAYPACTILPVLAALSLITSQPRCFFTSPSSVPWNRVRSSCLNLLMVVVDLQQINLKRRPSSLRLDHGWCVYSKLGEPYCRPPSAFAEAQRQVCTLKKRQRCSQHFSGVHIVSNQAVINVGRDINIFPIFSALCPHTLILQNPHAQSLRS